MNLSSKIPTFQQSKTLSNFFSKRIVTREILPFNTIYGVLYSNMPFSHWLMNYSDMKNLGYILVIQSFYSSFTDDKVRTIVKMNIESFCAILKGYKTMKRRISMDLQVPPHLLAINIPSQ